MVSAEITSTLAGVCSRVRPSRLPAVLVPVRLSVGAAKTGLVGAATGVPVLVATLRCCRKRAARVAVPRRTLRASGGVADGCTTTGSSLWLGLSDCARPSVDTTRQENATELRRTRRCRGVKIVGEVINRLAITWHVTANAVWPPPQEEDSSTPTRTPRPMCSRVTTTDGRSRGLRVVACHRLPRPEGPVAFGEGSPLTVAGAATALREIPAPHSLLISRRRTVATTLVLFEKHCQPMSAAPSRAVMLGATHDCGRDIRANATLVATPNSAQNSRLVSVTTTINLLDSAAGTAL